MPEGKQESASQPRRGQPKRGKVFTIPPGRSFLDDLARALLAGDLPCSGAGAPGPLDLAAMTVFLPTRRACQGFRAALLRASGTGAALLPDIRALGGEADDEEEDAEGPGAESAQIAASTPLSPDAALPATPLPLARHLTFTALTMRWAEAMAAGDVEKSGGEPRYDGKSAAQAFELAGELIALMDTISSEEAELGALSELVPEEFAEHWRAASGFLRIIAEHWPDHLAERGQIDGVARRNALLRRAALNLRARQEAGKNNAPVIIAGSTGSIPATAALMEAVLGLEQGAIVLPGLDLDLDEPSWAALEPEPGLAAHPEHPQTGMKLLLTRLGMSREEVSYLPGAEPDAPMRARERLISEALRPAETTERWAHYLETARTKRETLHAALAPLSLIEAPSPTDEAHTIALILREAAETPGKTAALISPDRALRRRVATALRSWGLELEDSAGRALAETGIGQFFDLVAALAANHDPVSLLALLKHPLSRLGLDEADRRAFVQALELTALRQPYGRPDIEDLADFILRTRDLVGSGQLRHPALLRLSEAEWDGALLIAERLAESLAPLLDLQSQRPVPLGLLVVAHRECAKRLSADQDGTPAHLWTGEEGEAMTAALSRVTEAGQDGLEPQLILRHYPPFFHALMRRETLYPAREHPRLFLWGPREARLQRPDLVILAELNEGVWPRPAETGPWLNRAMRERLGLPAPERRTGLAAHDFAQALGAPEIILTRALKRDGAPSVPSRWLRRLQTLLGGLGLETALKPPRPWAEWAALGRQAPPRQTIAPPAPCPPLHARPRKLAVSAVERWIANPYAIFAREILGLEPLPEIAGVPDERHRGIILHAALARFAKRFPQDLPEGADDMAATLCAMAEALLGELGEHAHIAAFWRPRLRRFAAWFAKTEPARRENTLSVLAEIPGEIMLDAPGGPFRLSARADRIDLLESGAIAIYDYKTGRIDARLRAAALLRAPQLLLEALIAREGGFAFLPREGAAIARLAYVSARGGEPAGEEGALSSDKLGALISAARDGLIRLIERFDLPQTPYAALRRPGFEAQARFDPYAHLARTDEWGGNFL